MKNNRMKDALENITRRDVPENTNLWSRITTGINEKKFFMKTLRTRPLMIVVIVAVALLLLTGVVYAIGKVTGYVPGIGLVDQNAPIRVLEKPIKVRQGALSIRVLKVVADAAQTLVVYSVNGIPARMDSQPICGLSPSLRLPNGTELQVLRDENIGGMGSENGFPMSYQTQINYAPVPAKIDDIMLVFPCILPIGVGPENWQVQIHLSPAPKEYATPAVEIGATFVASNPTFVKVPTPTTDMMIFTPEPNNLSMPAIPTSSLNASGLHLDKVIELPNSYILIGNFTDAGDLPEPVEINLGPYDDLPHMEDGTGQRVIFRVRTDIQPDNVQDGNRYWAYEVAKPVPGPLTITLDQVNITVTDTTQFTFDAGSNPQVGQKWELNLPVHLVNYDYVIDSVEVIKDGYRFNYHSGTDVPEGVSLQIIIIGSSPEQGSGKAINRKSVVTYFDSFTYSDSLPTGQLTVELTLSETVPLQGPWILSWMPPNPNP
jgi:hypothetical protein